MRVNVKSRSAIYKRVQKYRLLPLPIVVCLLLLTSRRGDHPVASRLAEGRLLGECWGEMGAAEDSGGPSMDWSSSPPPSHPSSGVEGRERRRGHDAIAIPARHRIPQSASVSLAGLTRKEQGKGASQCRGVLYTLQAYAMFGPRNKMEWGQDHKRRLQY